MKKKTKVFIWIAVGVGIAMLLWVLFSDIIGGAKELNFTQLMDAIYNGQYLDGNKIVKLDGRVTHVYLDA
ncbi:MAG: hypothetical protein IIX02_04980, partial [Clostridia bacterium]|nr:hypothetical protein [Clostridia bacterium]